MITSLALIERALTTQLYRELNDFFLNLVEPEPTKDSGDVLIKLDDETLWQGFSEGLADILTEYFTGAGQVGVESAGRQLGISLSWDHLNPRVADWAGEYAGRLVTYVTRGTKDRVRQVVTEALQSGAGWRSVREQLADEFGRSRAERIARTEVIRAHTRGALLGYEESGVVRGVTWLDGQNGACPLCRDLHQQTRPLGEPFYMDRFGDGHAPRHPHCRCAESPITLEMAARLPADHPLRDNRRSSVDRLTDTGLVAWLDQTINGTPLVVTGERKAHILRQHPELRGRNFSEVLESGLARPDHVVVGDRKPNESLYFFKRDDHWYRAVIAMPSKPWQGASVIHFRGCSEREVEKAIKKAR